MVTEAKASKRSKRRALRPDAMSRRERRFVAPDTTTGKLTLAGTCVGGALLGAGLYGQFVRAAGPLPYGPYLVGGGAVALAAVLLVTPDREAPFLVGDGGVGVDKGRENPTRIPWCRVERVALEGRAVVIAGEDTTLRIPVASQPQAAAWAVREALERVPSKVVIDSEAQASLPATEATAGEELELETPRVAGEHCAKSDRVIALEKDARLCPRCEEVYHKEEVPEACLTCGAALS